MGAGKTVMLHPTAVESAAAPNSPPVVTFLAMLPAAAPLTAAVHLGQRLPSASTPARPAGAAATSPEPARGVSPAARAAGDAAALADAKDDEASVTVVAWAPGGGVLATGDATGCVRVWDVSTLLALADSSGAGSGAGGEGGRGRVMAVCTGVTGGRVEALAWGGLPPRATPATPGSVLLAGAGAGGGIALWCVPPLPADGSPPAQPRLAPLALLEGVGATRVGHAGAPRVRRGPGAGKPNAGRWWYRRLVFCEAGDSSGAGYHLLALESSQLGASLAARWAPTAAADNLASWRLATWRTLAWEPLNVMATSCVDICRADKSTHLPSPPYPHTPTPIRRPACDTLVAANNEGDLLGFDAASLRRVWRLGRVHADVATAVALLPAAGCMASGASGAVTVQRLPRRSRGAVSLPAAAVALLLAAVVVAAVVLLVLALGAPDALTSTLPPAVTGSLLHVAGIVTDAAPPAVTHLLEAAGRAIAAAAHLPAAPPPPPATPLVDVVHNNM